MTQRITPATVWLLTLPPLMWAGNAVVGRMVSPLIAPMTLNLVRWAVAFLLLLPWAAPVLRRDSALWPHWRRFSMLGLLSIGLYNALQYLALHTSTPLNVTLVASSSPIWMMLIGRAFFKTRIERPQLLGAALSIGGVLVVLSRGQWLSLLHVQWVIGDAYMLLAAAAWAWYSWMLTQKDHEPQSLRADWAQFLLGQIAFGMLWAGVLAGGEWVLVDAHVQWSWALFWAVLFVAVGPSLVAYRCWGSGVRLAGPTLAAFFGNLTPLFAALLSTLLLGQWPHAYHIVAFALIAGGIGVSTVRPRKAPAGLGSR